MSVLSDTLKDRVRYELDDRAASPLVSDDQIYAAMAEAQQYLARETFCFIDSQNLIYDVAADAEWVSVSESILRPRHIGIVGTDNVLEPIVQADLPERAVTSDYGRLVTGENWRSQTDVYPRYAVTDMAKAAWRLVPVPTAALQLHVEAWIYPRDPAEGRRLTLPHFGDHALVHGAARNLLMYQDCEIYDPNKAAHHERRWMEYLGLIRDDEKRHARPSRYLRQRRGYW